MNIDNTVCREVTLSNCVGQMQNSTHSFSLLIVVYDEQCVKVHSGRRLKLLDFFNMS